MGEWYVKHLGFVVKRASDAPVPVRFLADETGRVMIEIYRNARIGVPDYRSADPLTFHLAFVCDDLEPTVERLVKAGASVVVRESNPAGDQLIMMRDPWHIPIQLCKRSRAMVGD
jgi:hypothetical protein